MVPSGPEVITTQELKRKKSPYRPVGRSKLLLAENTLHHPHWRNQHMDWIRQECRPITLDDVAERGEPESSGNQQEGDNPVEPDDNEG